MSEFKKLLRIIGHENFEDKATASRILFTLSNIVTQGLEPQQFLEVIVLKDIFELFAVPDKQIKIEILQLVQILIHISNQKQLDIIIYQLDLFRHMNSIFFVMDLVSAETVEVYLIVLNEIFKKMQSQNDEKILGVQQTFLKYGGGDLMEEFQMMRNKLLNNLAANIIEDYFPCDTVDLNP